MASNHYERKLNECLQLMNQNLSDNYKDLSGMVNLYRDFWKTRAHLMAPLTSLTKIDKKICKGIDK